MATVNGVDYCKACAFIHEDEQPGDEYPKMPEQPKADFSDETRWGKTFTSLSSLPMNKSMTLEPDKGDVKQFRNNLRSALAQNNKTMEFKWSIRIDGQQVRLKKVGLWADQDALMQGQKVEMTHQKKTETVERHTVEVSRIVTPPVKQEKGRDHQLSITLESGGFLTVLFDCGNFFELSKQDRDFVYSIIDRMNNYSNPDKMNIARSGKDGEKLYPVMMPVSALEEIFRNCADDSEAAALYAAWYRDDPAIRPVKDGGK